MVVHLNSMNNNPRCFGNGSIQAISLVDPEKPVAAVKEERDEDKGLEAYP